jgi:hypothetical protein
MEEPVTSCHAYSCLPQDHKKVYLQTYYGHLDLRNKITKDYYAISKDNFKIVASHVRDQPMMLERDEKRELVATPLAKGKTDKVNDRELTEIGRLTRKVERLLQAPVKVFFTSKNDAHDILFVNRLGFDILIGDEPEVPVAAPETIVNVEPAQSISQPEQIQSPAPVEQPPVEQIEELKQEIEQASEALIEREDFIVEEKAAISPKLLVASMKILHHVVERKYKSTFADAPDTDLGSMISKLNEANVFSRPVDSTLLLQAEEAAKNDSAMQEDQYTKTIEEIAYILSYA